MKRKAGFFVQLNSTRINKPWSSRVCNINHGISELRKLDISVVLFLYLIISSVMGLYFSRYPVLDGLCDLNCLYTL